jgi:hypothetical protein
MGGNAGEPNSEDFPLCQHVSRWTPCQVKWATSLIRSTLHAISDPFVGLIARDGRGDIPDVIVVSGPRGELLKPAIRVERTDGLGRRRGIARTRVGLIVDG